MRYLFTTMQFYTDCNEAALKLLGMNDKSQIAGKYPWDISPEFQPDGRSSREKANEMVKVVYEQGYNRFEWMHSRLDGTQFWVDVTLTKVQYGDRETVYSIWRDIDEKKKTLLALEQSERNYREIFNSSSEMIIVTDSLNHGKHGHQ